MAISIHLIDMSLDEECMIYQRSLADMDMGKQSVVAIPLNAYT